ncbi:MAG: orotate phosphoribosyltransferase, partial [Lachnospiraceae bacterium]|nr:orotate phosphoribosyltransferase [Lachnospiraceae bacterium]
YYGGVVCGICAVFSAISKVAGIEVKTIFTCSDIPDCKIYNSHECPMCKAGEKLDGIVNSFGYARL